MVIGNYMNLSGISQRGFKWFMEFSCDSYECYLPNL